MTSPILLNGDEVTQTEFDALDAATVKKAANGSDFDDVDAVRANLSLPFDLWVITATEQSAGTAGLKETICTHNVPAGLLADLGDGLTAWYGSVGVGHATATRRWAVEIGGQTVVDTAVGLAAASGFELQITVEVLRKDNTTVIGLANIQRLNLSTGVSDSAPFTFEKTVANLTTTSLSVAIMGYVGGAGAQAGDIKVKSGRAVFRNESV